MIAFIVGWMNTSKWGINNVMLVWSAAIVAGIVLQIISFAVLGAQFGNMGG